MWIENHKYSPREIVLPKKNVLNTTKTNDRLISLNEAKEWLRHNASKYTVGNDLIKEFEHAMLAGR